MDWSIVNVTDVVNGAMVIVMLILAWVARTFGAKAKSSPPEQMELAGAIIDKTQAARLEDAFTKHTKALEALGRGIDDNTQALRENRREVSDLSHDVQALTVWIGRISKD